LISPPPVEHKVLDGLGLISAPWGDFFRRVRNKTISEVATTHKAPASMTVNTGTLISGSVSSVASWQDGDYIEIQEASGVPGFDIEFTFTGITTFSFLSSSSYYDGSSSHHVTISLYDNVASSWKILYTYSAGNNYNYRFSDIPTDNIEKFISDSREVKIRFYHPVSGDASHDLFIDYLALIS
jgi:hypothetical protein